MAEAANRRAGTDAPSPLKAAGNPKAMPVARRDFRSTGIACAPHSSRSRWQQEKYANGMRDVYDGIARRCGSAEGAPCPAIRAREGIDATSARALHFAGPIKPWMPEAMLRWTRGDPDHKPRDAFRRWYDACLGYLADAHVRSAGDRRRKSRGSRG